MDSQHLGNLHTRSYGQPNPMDSIARWRMDTEEFIGKFENLLLGRVKNSQGRWEDNQEGMKICNEKGAAYARIILNALVNKNTIQGNLTEEGLMRTLLSYAYTIIEHVGKMYGQYGIEKEMRATYVSMLMNQIHIALTRPIGDKEREYSVTQAVERSNVVQRLQEGLSFVRPPNLM